MTMAPQPETIRRLVAHTFAEFGASNQNLELNETLLISNHRYVARSYRAEGLMAMWIIDIGLVQFYDADGTMLRTINLFKEATSQRLAA
jgi:hypothetical protein